jgi:hypothetical protein
VTARHHVLAATLRAKRVSMHGLRHAAAVLAPV